MIRMLRAAPWLLVAGLSAGAAGCAAVALAQAGNVGVTEFEMRAFVYERMAAALLLLIGAAWGAAWRVLAAAKGYIDELKASIGEAAHKFESGVERLSDALVKHDTSPVAHLEALSEMREKTDRLSDAVDDLMRGRGTQ